MYHSTLPLASRFDKVMGKCPETTAHVVANRRPVGQLYSFHSPSSCILLIPRSFFFSFSSDAVARSSQLGFEYRLNSFDSNNHHLFMIKAMVSALSAVANKEGILKPEAAANGRLVQMVRRPFATHRRFGSDSSCIFKFSEGRSIS